MAKKQTINKGNKVAKEKPLVPNWTPKNAILVGVIASLLTCGGGYLFVVQPALAEKAAQQEALSSATSNLQTAQDTLRVAQNYEAQYPDARKEYDSLVSQFPNTAAVNDLNTQIEGLASRHGVSVRSLNTQVPVLIASNDAPVAEPPAVENTETSADDSIPVPDALPTAPASTLARVDVSLVVQGSGEGVIGFTRDLKEVDRSLIISTTVFMEEGEEYSMNISGVSYLYAPIEDPIATLEKEQQDAQKQAEDAQSQTQGETSNLQEDQTNN